jgi:predicted oxidoreductase
VTHPVAPLATELAAHSVRYVVIGVSGANLYGPGGQSVFITKDIDLFLPQDPENLLRAWEACERAAFELWLGDEPLDRPRDLWLAERVVERRALTRVTGPNELWLDLTLVMAGFDFETVWAERREFRVEGVGVPTARLLHIIESKHAAGRPKDQLFLATHKDALEQLLKKPD